MMIDQARSIPSNRPVLCADGMVGQFIIYPRETDPRCGVQVPGEMSARWICCSELKLDSGGRVRQRGAGRPCHPVGDAVQRLLVTAWVRPL